MWPVWGNVQPKGQYAETPATLLWSQTTTTTTTTTTAPPPTFTINHRYTSMGGAVKRYNIDNQETQHLDYLSPTLYLLLPTMKSFQDKHRAYKFQVAITIVCHKAVDPSVVIQPPVTLTSEMIAVYAADSAPPLDNLNQQQLNFLELFELNGSGWVFSHFQDLQLTLWQLDPLRGSAYIPLPRWIQTRRAVVIVVGTGDNCFKWAMLTGMRLVDENAHRRVNMLNTCVSMAFLLCLFPPLSSPLVHLRWETTCLSMYMAWTMTRRWSIPSASHPHSYRIDMWICYCSNLMV